MAFTGTPVVQQVADNLVRITGVSLAGIASGTIGLATKTTPAEVSLPEGFQPGQYSRGDDLVTLQDLVQVSIEYAGAVDNPVALSVVKTGTSPADFQIAITNTELAASLASPTLEIYIRGH